MLCRRRRASILLLTWFTTIVRQKSPASGPSTSRAAQVYTPAGNLASRSSPGQQPNRGGATSTKSQISNQTGHHRRPPTTQQNQVLAPNTPIRFILFGVKGPPPFLVPAQISVEENSTDHSVFQELRALYKLNRGWLRLWFSVWDLETCQGTRVWTYNTSTCSLLTLADFDLSFINGTASAWPGNGENCQPMATMNISPEHRTLKTRPFHRIFSRVFSTSAPSTASGACSIIALCPQRAATTSNEFRSEAKVSKATWKNAPGDLRRYSSRPSYVSPST